MEGNLVIREYTDADAEGVASLYNKCAFYHAEYGYQISQADIIASYKERGTYMLVVAIADSNLVGILGCFPVSGQKVAEKNAAFIGSLLVHPEYRGGTLIKSLYAEMIRKVIEKGFTCICTEIFPSNDLSLRLAKRTGYVYTRSCRTDMDDYIDLKSYLPVTLQCFYATDGITDDKSTLDVYKLGFTLLYSREQQRKLYITSEIEEENREIVTYPIKIENAKYVIKVDVLSQSVSSLESEYFKVSCHLVKGNQYNTKEMFTMQLKIENLSSENLKVKLITSKKNSVIPIFSGNYILSEKGSKELSKKLREMKPGQYVVETKLQIQIGGNKNYYLRLGIGYEIGQLCTIELESIDVKKKQLDVNYLMKDEESAGLVPSMKRACITWNYSRLSFPETLKQLEQQDIRNRILAKKISQHFSYEEKCDFEVVRFASNLIISTESLKLIISLSDGRTKLYTGNGEHIMSELWPDVCYPHISGLKIDSQRKITYSVEGNTVILKHKTRKYEVKRCLTIKNNKIKVAGCICNLRFEKIEASVGKIQPWLEWSDAQMFVPSNDAVFRENMVYNVFPLGISDMIVGNINEFFIDTDENQGGWAAYASKGNYLKFSWKSCSEVRFGQNWMPCLMFETNAIGAMQSMDLPEYEYCLYESDRFLRETGKKVCDYVFLKKGLASIEILKSGQSVLKVCAWLETFSNFNLKGRVFLHVMDLQGNNLYTKKYEFTTFNRNSEVEIVDHIVLDNSILDQDDENALYRVVLQYEDQIRLREFSIMCPANQGKEEESLFELKKEKGYEKYQVGGTKFSFSVVPCYGQSITEIIYQDNDKLSSSYPNCIPYEAEENWYGGISNYIIASGQDKLSCMLKPEERITNISYQAAQEECRGYTFTGIQMHGNLRGGTVNNSITYTIIQGTNIMVLTSLYQGKGKENEAFTSVFSIYPKLAVQNEKKYNFYLNQEGNGKQELTIFKKMDVVAVCKGRKYAVFEDLEQMHYMTVVCGDREKQEIYFNHLKAGMNLCILQPVELKNEKPEEVHIFVGFFKTKEEAKFFGEKAEEFYRQLITS